MGINKKLEKKFLEGARQSRANRVQKSANKYKGGKLSKSQQAYINGDYRSAISMREYGYKQAKDFKGVTYYTGGRSRDNYEKLQQGYNPYQVRYYVKNYQDKNYVPGGVSKTTGNKYNGFYTNRHKINSNQLGTLLTRGKLTQQAQDNYNAVKDRQNSYSILRPYNANPRNFGETLNTGVLDGLRVARNRVNKGGSKLNYLGGGLKDFIVDPLIDVLKSFDRYESSALNAGLGAIQTGTELADALTKKGVNLSDVDWGHAKKNWDASIATSNKIGFGDTAGESLKKIVKGTQDRQLKNYKSGGNSLVNWWESKFSDKKSTDYNGLRYQRDLHTDKNKRLDETGSFVSGLLLDILNPVQIGSKVMGASSKLIKKSANEVKNGSKAGIVSDPEGIEWLNNITRKTTEKFRNGKSKTNHVDDLFHETEDAYRARKAMKGVDKDVADNLKRVTAQMDNEYARQVAKADNPVKSVISNNPNTQNLNKFIDDMENVTTKQMHLWRRIRNNKRMTKDGYIPNTINRTDDVIEDVKNAQQIPGQIGIDEVMNRPQQIDMFDQLGLPKHDFTPNPPTHTPYKEVSNKPLTHQQTIDEFLNYSDERKMTNLMKILDENGEELFKYIDELPDEEGFRMLDYLERYEPELYQKYVGIDDYMDNEIVRDVAKQQQKTIQAEKLNKEIKKASEVVIKKSDVPDEEFFKRANAKQLDKVDHTPYTMKSKGKMYQIKLFDFAKRIDEGEIQLDAVRALTTRLKNANIPTKEKVKFINNNLFNGSKIILDNVSEGTIKQFCEHLEDIYKVLDNNRQVRNGVVTNFGSHSLSDTLQQSLAGLSKRKKYTKLPEVTSDKFLGDLVESISDLKGTLVDPNYWNKMRYLANMYQYNKKSDIVDKINQMKALRSKYDSMTKTKAIIDEQTRLSAEIKRLQEVMKSRDTEKNAIMALEDADWNKYLMNHPYMVNPGENLSGYKRLTNFLEGLRQNFSSNKFLNDANVNVERDMRELTDELSDASKHNNTPTKDWGELRKETVAENKRPKTKMSRGAYNRWINLKTDLKDKARAIDNAIESKRASKNSSVNKKFVDTEGIKRTENIEKQIDAIEKIEQTKKNFNFEDAYYFNDKVNTRSSNPTINTEFNHNLNNLLDYFIKEYKFRFTNAEGYESYKHLMDAVKNDYMDAMMSFIPWQKNNPAMNKKMAKQMYDNFNKIEKMASDKVRNFYKVLDELKIEPPISNASGKFFNGNRAKLPEVQKNLQRLKGIIEEEVNQSLKKGSKFDDSLFYELKQDYIKAIQSYGVDTKLIKQNANEYLEALVNAEKNPVTKMNLQMLASHFSDQIDDIIEVGAKPNTPLDDIKNFEDPWDSTPNTPKPDDTPTSPMDDLAEQLRNEGYTEEQIKDTIETLNGNHPPQPKPEPQQLEYTHYPEPNSDPLSNPLLGENKPTPHNYIKNEKEILDQLGGDMSSVLNNRIKKFLKDRVGINKNNKKKFKLKGTKEELKQQSIFDTVLDKNKNVIDKNTGEVVYNNKNKQEFINENRDNELLKNYYGNKKKADKIKEFFNTIKNKFENGENVSDMELSTFLDSIGLKHDITRPSSLKEAVDKFKNYLYNLVEDGDVDYDEISGLFLPDNYKPGSNMPRPENPFNYNNKPNNKPKPQNKPNTPNTPHTPLDDVPKPDDVPHTPLDDVPKPENNPKPNTNDKPKPNSNKNDKSTKVNLYDKVRSNPVFDLYKRYLNTWKKGVTVYNPGWHLANFLQNKGQNYLALGTDAFAPQTQARKMLDYIKGNTDKIDDVVLNDGTVLSGDKIAQYAMDSGIAEGAQATQIMQEPRTLIPWLDKKLDDSKLLQKLSRNEETARLHHYLTQIKRGMSEEDAVKSVNKYLFDYANKSKSEHFVEDFIDPFYVFHKSYAKLLGSEALTNPSKINNILRMEREITNSTPESSRNQNASDTKFQMPFGSFTDKENNARYDYMAKQYMFPEIQSALPLTYEEVEGKLNPLLKLAIQQTRGKGDFDTDIVEGKAGWNEINKDDRKKEIALDVNPFVNNLPTTIDKVNKLNGRKQSKETTDLQKMELIFNYLTGNKGKHERYLDFLK